MFRRNITVFILPLLLMGFIFYGGYYFLEEANQMTNEELSQLVSLEIDGLTASEEKFEITGAWNWNEVPQDGILGEDYIGISVTNSLGEALTGSFLDGNLQLIFQDEIIYETEGQESDNGYLFAFPNEFRDQVVYGNEGNFSISLELEQNEDVRFIVSYLHTWSNHGGLINEDTRFLAPQFKNSTDEAYWVIERFVEWKAN